MAAGSTLDGHIWCADAFGRRCVLVAEGGEVLAEVPRPGGLRGVRRACSAAPTVEPSCSAAPRACRVADRIANQDAVPRHHHGRASAEPACP